MKFLRHLQDTKLSELALLDFAYLVVLLPLIIMLKIPMILFSIIAMSLILFKRTPTSNILLFSLFLLGIVALYLSLYGAFSFAGLSRLKLFLELLIYILIIIVTIQRLTGVINFYLLISPFLFLALSLFFYHGILMLIYVVFEIFVLLWMILSHRMQGDVKEGFKGKIYATQATMDLAQIILMDSAKIMNEDFETRYKKALRKGREKKISKPLYTTADVETTFQIIEWVNI